MSHKQPDPPSKIIMLAPIAIVLVVYSFLFLSPQQTQLQSAQDRFNTLSKTHHNEHEITDIRLQSERLKKEIRQLADQTHDLQHARDELLAQRNQMRHELESHALPAATMQRVTRLMETHQLRVIESQQDSGAASQAEKVLKSVQDLLKDDPSTKSKFAHDHTHGHTHHSPTSHHQAHHAHSHDGHTHFEREVYKLKVRGRFQDLQAALEALAAELEHVMPLSLQMEPMELDSSEARQSQRVWTLTIMV